METMHKLGLTLNSREKTRLLDECVQVSKTRLDRMKTECFLCHFVGDNLDIRITPRIVTSEHQVKDCHYYAVLVMFSKMSRELREMKKNEFMIPESIHPTPSNLLLSEAEKKELLNSYAFLLLKLMSRNMKAFGWLEAVLPEHFEHPWADNMRKKTVVCGQPLILKHEMHLDQCVDILTETWDENAEYLKNGKSNVIDDMLHMICYYSPNFSSRINLIGNSRIICRM